MSFFIYPAAFLYLLGGIKVVRGAESHIVVDAKTGFVLLSKDENTPREVASLTKVATVLAALEWVTEKGAELSIMMPVSKSAVSGGVNPLKLQLGDSLSIESALFAAMMASDNTSAYVLAEYVGSEMAPGNDGDVAVGVFVERMNRLASDLVMSSTRFVNPHGLDGATTRGKSTAADMARLTIHAYEEPGFSRLVSEKEKEIVFFRDGNPVAIRVNNTNALVGSRGIDGVKTGTTSRAGACLITSSVGAGENDSARLISVVLKADDRFRESVILLSDGWQARGEWLAKGGEIGENESLLSAGN